MRNTKKNHLPNDKVRGIVPVNILPVGFRKRSTVGRVGNRAMPEVGARCGRASDTPSKCTRRNIRAELDQETVMNAMQAHKIVIL